VSIVLTPQIELATVLLYEIYQQRRYSVRPTSILIVHQLLVTQIESLF